MIEIFSFENKAGPPESILRFSGDSVLLFFVMIERKVVKTNVRFTFVCDHKNKSTARINETSSKIRQQLQKLEE
ncbi:hypothetical protein CYK55_11525 [Enterococcus mundtii]|nr:hypothetical protein CYK55_11525 [Enterococcus mundtii]EYT97054.1 hypothetical protein AK89_01095 [Enterococcus mundtii CRL35]